MGVFQVNLMSLKMGFEKIKNQIKVQIKVVLTMIIMIKVFLFQIKFVMEKRPVKLQIQKIKIITPKVEIQISIIIGMKQVGKIIQVHFTIQVIKLLIVKIV